MNRQLDTHASSLLSDKLKKLGIKIKLNANTKAIHGKAGIVTQLELDSGETLETDLVVFAAGIKPNFKLAQQAGLTCNKGIIVNNKLQSSHTDIYALGECTEYNGHTFGLVAPVYKQADILAKILLNQDTEEFDVEDYPTQLKVSGVEVFSAGDFSEQKNSDEIILKDEDNDVYRRLIIQNNKLIGAVLFGNKHDSNWYADLIKQKTSIDNCRHTLMFGSSFN